MLGEKITNGLLLLWIKCTTVYEDSLTCFIVEEVRILLNHIDYKTSYLKHNEIEIIIRKKKGLKMMQ